MELYVDLHIHSALSPCGDDDMTPNNIINMAIIKGLDLISVTDHNNISNIPAISNVASKMGIMFLPGIEVQTKEEVHMLCYFKTPSAALEFGDMIFNMVPNIKNNETLFGKQLIMDEHDNIINSVDKLLLSSADISIDGLISLVNKYNGVCIPAHVDKTGYSIISNLGFIPSNLKIKTVEISKKMDTTSAIKKFPLLKDLRIIKSSDAHYLWDISERENFIQLQEMTFTNILDYLKGI